MSGKGTAVITGATSGIGASFAHILAERGYDLLITGRRADKINALADKLRAENGVSVQVALAELSDEKQLDGLADEISTVPAVSLLINNAGFGGTGLFSENPERHRAMLAVHVAAAVRLTAAVAPRMIAAGGGTIINVCSVAAFFPMPGSATYSATKRYLITFSESLHTELFRHGIHVQALCPGMTRTDFHERLGDEGKQIEKRYIFGWMSPDKVAELSLRRAGARTVVYVPGLVNKFLVHVVSKLPKRLYYSAVSRIRG